MNGRVYDPRIGRFVSPDPYVQNPTNSQSHNRYAYVYNNPLSYSDPSGFYSKRLPGSDGKGGFKLGRFFYDLATAAAYSINPVAGVLLSQLRGEVSDTDPSSKSADFDEEGNRLRPRFGMAADAYLAAGQADSVITLQNMKSAEAQYVGISPADFGLSENASGPFGAPVSGANRVSDEFRQQESTWKLIGRIEAGGGRKQYKLVVDGGRELMLDAFSDTLGLEGFNLEATPKPLDTRGNLADTMEPQNYDGTIRRAFSAGMHTGMTFVIRAPYENKYGFRWYVVIPPQEQINQNSAGYSIIIHSR